MNTIATLHLQDECPRAGSGFRTFIILPSKGNRWVRLFYWPELTTCRMARVSFERLLVETKPAPREVISLVREKAKLYRRHKLPFNKKNVKAILDAGHQ